MELKVRPLKDRVIVLPDAAEEKTEGGIIIPDTAKEKPAKGVIVAVGPGTVKEPMEAKVGDRVLYSKYSGTEIEFDKEIDPDKNKYLIMRESEVLLVY